MHVNKEARAIALMNLEMTKPGSYPWGKCPVAQRPFRPDTDTLYASRTLIPYHDFSGLDVAKVQHLVLDFMVCAKADMLALIEYSLQYMPALRTLGFVLPATQLEGCDSPKPCLPDRRCALRCLGREEFEKLSVFSRGQYWENRDTWSTSITSPARLTFRDSISQLLILAMGEGGPWEVRVEPLGKRDASTPMVWNIAERQRARELGIHTQTISFEICLISEYCYSPSGNSRSVAVGEGFPDSPDPSDFAALNASKYQNGDDLSTNDTENFPLLP
ncbi:hypothetical protein NUW58_g8537 [Xylaria curta]|uniref:Uncharacterized protein n=1 Tax=Xylaria curta TaxID=42375 RepID=A0ACC1N8N4_9PEZI|nr:hypothetical protein NUW58_g8537 [Xylaria curta]